MNIPKYYEKSIEKIGYLDYRYFMTIKSIHCDSAHVFVHINFSGISSSIIANQSLL